MVAGPRRAAPVRCGACLAVSAPSPGSPGIHAPSCGTTYCCGPAGLRRRAVLRRCAAPVRCGRRTCRGWREAWNQRLSQSRRLPSGWADGRLARVAASQAGRPPLIRCGDLVHRTPPSVARGVGGMRHRRPRDRGPWHRAPWLRAAWRRRRRAVALVAAFRLRRARGLGDAGAVPNHRWMQPLRVPRPTRQRRRGRAWQARNIRLTWPGSPVGRCPRLPGPGHRIPGARDPGIRCPAGIRRVGALGLPSRGAMNVGALVPRRPPGLAWRPVMSGLRCWRGVRGAPGCELGVRRGRLA